MWRLAAKGFERLAQDGCSWRCQWPLCWRPRALNKAADLVAEVGHQGDSSYKLPETKMAEILREIDGSEYFIRCFSDGGLRGDSTVCGALCAI